MKPLQLVLIALAVLSLTAAVAWAADRELWPEMSAPDNRWCCLPNEPEAVTGDPLTTAESDEGVFLVDVHQTLEHDGLLYKAIQIHRDYVWPQAVEVPVGRYMIVSAYANPSGTVDLVSWTTTGANLVAMEIDGEVVDIDASMILHRQDAPMPGWEACPYAVFPRFNSPGEHSLSLTFQPQEPFFYVEPYAAQGLVDPSPEFEGRRVMVPEQVGDPVDGKIVLQWHLRVVDEPTSVEPCSWARIKAALPE